jgi:hypothetical protein
MSIGTTLAVAARFNACPNKVTIRAPPDNFSANQGYNPVVDGLVP